MTRSPSPPAADESPHAQVLRHARREALWVVKVAVVVFLFTTLAGYLWGYRTHQPGSSSWGPPLGQLLGPLESWNRTPESVRTPGALGIPDWIVWSVVLPWLGCLGLTWYFCWVVFEEDPLGDDLADLDSADLDSAEQDRAELDLTEQDLKGPRGSGPGAS